MLEPHSQPDSANSESFFRLIIALLCMWTIFGLIAFLQFRSSVMDNGEHAFTFLMALELGVGNAWLKAMLSIPVLWALQRFNAKPRSMASLVATYTAMAIAFIAAHVMIRPLVLPVYIIGADAKSWSYGQILIATLRSFTMDDALAFALTAAGFHAWRYARETRVRAVREEALRTQLANAELSLLKMQLQPHFLFNTLNTIYCLAPENSRKAQQMIERLSHLLRLSLDHLSSNAVPLSRELEFLDAYLDIESTRFEERLQVVREVDPEVLQARMPSMILQPLVENAIRHGVGKLAGGGTIKLKALRRNDRVTIWITNDYHPSSIGNGNGKSGGLGLANTRARLTQMFGDDFLLRLETLSDHARVTIDVPLRPMTEDDFVQEDVWTR